jgi:tetratricopeptide (TPR) repeat protein
MGAAYDMAVILYRQKRYEMARQQLSRELADQPNNANAFAMLALCLAEQKQFRAARRQAEQAIAIGPSLAFAHYCLAWVFYKDHSFSCRRRVAFCRNQAALRRKRLKLAETTLDEAIRLAPCNADYLGLLGWIRYELGNFRGASDAALQGLEVDPSSNDCLRVQAYVLQARGKIDAAQRVSGTALSAHPENVLTHVAHGRSLLLSGSHLAALEHFREAMRLDPNSSAARTSLISGLCARNSIVRRLIAPLRIHGFGRATNVIVLLAIVAGLLALPFLPGVFNLHIPSRLARYSRVAPLVLTATVPAAVFLLSPILTLFLLQFDREGRHLLPLRQRVGASAFVAFVAFFYLFLAFGGILTPSQEDLIIQSIAAILAAVIWLVLPIILIRRSIIRFRNWRRIRSQGNQLQ